MRVYELLDQKFKLFSGVFGASDEVLGAVESGVDFEKRIAAIYQRCRTPKQIEFEFDQLQLDLEGRIAAGVQDAREKLLDNFDQEVVEKVRVQSRDHLDRFNEQLWMLTQHVLAEFARFDGATHSFTLHKNPFPGDTIHAGPYRMGKRIEDANTYRVGHPLAQRVLDQGRSLTTPVHEVAFEYAASGKKIAVIDALVGQSGWLACWSTTIHALETEDQMVLVGESDDGRLLDDAQCRRLFDLQAQLGIARFIPPTTARRLDDATKSKRQTLLADLEKRNARWFETEIDKLDRWADDLKTSILRKRLDEYRTALKDGKRAVRLAATVPEKLQLQREARALESRIAEAEREFEQKSREIEAKKDALLDAIESRLGQRVEEGLLFTFRWHVV